MIKEPKIELETEPIEISYRNKSAVNIISNRTRLYIFLGVLGIYYIPPGLEKYLSMKTINNMIEKRNAQLEDVRQSIIENQDKRIRTVMYFEIDMTVSKLRACTDNIKMDYSIADCMENVIMPDPIKISGIK